MGRGESGGREGKMDVVGVRGVRGSGGIRGKRGKMDVGGVRGG